MLWAYLVLGLAVLVMYLPCLEVTKKFSRDFEGPFRLAHMRAIDKCLAITAKHWESPMKTRVKFMFKPFFNRSHVADTRFEKIHTPRDNIMWTSAMLKSIIMVDGPQEYDIIITLDTKQKWYTGLDGKPGEDEMDLVTVCMHEMQHGLLGEVELIFLHTDKQTRFEQLLGFETNDSRYCSLKTLKNEKHRMYEAVSSGHVFFFENFRPIAKMFAPNPYYRVPSLHHFDRSRYEDSMDRLLLDIYKPGVATHYIGPQLRNIHRAMKNWEDEGATVCEESVGILRVD